VRAPDRTPILAVVEVSRLIRELEHHLFLAYQERALAALTPQARTDPLTGLANRRAFDERMGAEVARVAARAARRPGAPRCGSAQARQRYARARGR